MTNNLLSIGHGFSARAVSACLAPKGWHIWGTTRDSAKFSLLKGTHADPLLWPGTDLTEYLKQARCLLISTAPGPDGDPFLKEYADWLRANAAGFDWVGYLSTTGVYGDHQGEWVDETTPLAPTTKRGRARVKAENEWQSVPGLPLHIFRLAGIYGPGRGPFAKVRKGTARRIIKPNQVFSRIHVDDIASAIALSIANPDPGAIYNLCDDDPAPPQDVIAFAAELLNTSLPPAEPFETADMTPMARSFYAESKRVRNDHAKVELGWTPAFPDYKTGLRALLANEIDNSK